MNGGGKQSKLIQRHSATIVLLFLLLLSLFVGTNASAQFSSSASIAIHGTIASSGDRNLGLELKYETDFEDIYKISPQTLSLPINHGFTFGPYADMWVEGLDRNSSITPHSGSRCIGMEVTNTSTNIRNEFNIVNLDSFVGSKLFVSVWLYLPSNWGLYDPNWNWYTLANPMMSQGPTYLPYWSVHVVNPSSYRIDIDASYSTSPMLETPAGSVVQDPPAYPLPLGRWFNIQYYVLRSSASGLADGSIYVWIDGRVVCHLTNVITKSNEDYFTTIAKIYGSLVQEAMPYRQWVDDLQIYGE
jgi:hypothetical protein